MQTALLTGCTGEIGNALVKLLLDRGVRVHALCRRGSWRRRFLPYSDRLNIVECDIFDLKSAVGVIPEPCDAFFHLGWHASYGKERADPYGQVRNIAAALDAVELSVKTGCSVFVGAGSQAQYGDTEEELAPDTPMQPVSAYGAAKACAEAMTRELCAAKGIRHVWGRVISVYGPCDGPYTLLTYLMRSYALEEEAALTPCGQLWDFLYSEDAARAFLAMAERGKDGAAYCVAAGASRPLREYIEEYLAVAGERARVRIGGKEYPQNQRMRLAADISTLRADTGFEPTVSFKEGMRKTLEWYVAHPEALGIEGRG